MDENSTTLGSTQLKSASGTAVGGDPGRSPTLAGGDSGQATTRVRGEFDRSTALTGSSPLTTYTMGGTSATPTDKESVADEEVDEDVDKEVNEVEENPMAGK